MTNIEIKYNVALLCGGKSTEREISLKSGAGAKEALLEAGHKVTVFDPSKKDELVKLIDGNFDVAFLCMHGKYGEDGTLQGFLETIEMPYTGSGVWSSATSIDKAKTKNVYKEREINTPKMLSVKKENATDVSLIMNELGEHCVVKAVQGGSTIGIYIAESAKQITESINEAFKYDDEVLVEKFITGKEFTVPVIGNDNPEALPVIQIIPKNGFYDFDAKYAPGGSEHLCPAPVSDELTERMQKMAIEAHRALNCAGVSRTDILVDEDDVCWAIETNSLPGMTKTSLLPEAGRVAGIPFPELCTKLIEYALERYENKIH